MPKWTETDPAYLEHLERVASKIVIQADESHKIPTLSDIERWHRDLYSPVADPPVRAGKIRCQGKHPALNVPVSIGDKHGCLPAIVPFVMATYCGKLRQRIQDLDTRIASLEDGEDLEEIASLVAWAHGEFARIHPFCDGNGRMSRLIANILLLRYDTPYQLTYRPRPSGDYGVCGRASMDGDHEPMKIFLLNEIVAASVNFATKSS